MSTTTAIPGLGGPEGEMASLTVDESSASSTTDANASGSTSTEDFPVNFDTEGTFPPDNRVFEVETIYSPQEGAPSRIEWTKRKDETGLELVSVSLLTDKYVNGTFDMSIETLEWSAAAASTEFFSNLADDGVDVNFERFLEGSINTDFEPATDDDLKYLAVRVDWQNSDSDGYTISPFFAVIADDNSELAATLQRNLNSEEQERRAIIGSNWDKNDDEATNGGDGGDGGADTEDGNGSGGETSPNDGDGNDDNNEAGEPSGNGSPLSKGAIAGIAVGGVIFLVAVGVLIWFLLRRRRRSKPKGRTEYSQSPDLTNDYIRGKEANDVDLQSPYSEDGVNATQRTPLEPNTTRPGATESHSSFTPYHDTHPGDGSQNNRLAPTVTNTSVSTHPNSAVDETRGAHERLDGGVDSNRSTPQSGGRSRNVAHLVEDGMTEDDIRRLEEEERQLDFEIERAGRR